MSQNPDNKGEARPGPAEEAGQPQAPAPRKAPVRFQDPVEQPSERAAEAWPVFYQNSPQEREQPQSSDGTRRYQPFYEDEDERAEGRASSSSVLGEIERERESPTPISGDRRVEGDQHFPENDDGVRLHRRDESPPPPLPQKVRTGSGDSDELDLRIRRDRQSSYGAGRSRDRPSAPTAYTQWETQPRRRVVETRERGRSYHDEDDELDIRVPSHQRSPQRREGSGYYDEDGELDIRVRRGRATPAPVVYPEHRYRPIPHPEHRGTSTHYDEADELDNRTRRDYIYPAPVVYPEHRYRPAPRPYYGGSASYLIPTSSRERREAYELEVTRRELEAYKLAQAREVYEVEKARRELDAYKRAQNREEYELERSRLATYAFSPINHTRSHSRIPPSIAPVIINDRIYNDLEDDEYEDTTIRRSRHRSRSGPGILPEPAIINNTRAYSDDGDSQYRALAFNRRLPEVGLDAITQAYSFSLSRHTRNSESTRSISGSMSDVSEQSEPSQEEPLKIPPSSGRTHNILRSQYVGDGLVSGQHAVELTVTPESDLSRRKSISPIFRWVHFEDLNMDFEQFQTNVLNISHLADAERSAISKLLAQAKKKYDRPRQTSRNMAPSFLQDNISGEMRPKASRARTVSWLCVPYFCLARYATSSSLRPSSHPMRTLLQARYSQVQKKRDMEQAVCQVSGTPPEHCFYIGQIWILILDDSLIVSCAQSPISSLQGESITIVPNPTESSTTLSQNILIYTKNSLLWSLPVNECQDWFAFVSHFWEYWPRPFQITHHEKVITAEDWPKVFVIAKKSTIRLSIDFRPNTKEPVKGILHEDPISEEGSTKDTTDRTSDNSDSKRSSRPSLQVRDQRRSKSDVSPHGNKDGFHIFTWSTPTDESRNTYLAPPAVNISQDSPNVEGPKLEEDQKEIDDFLRLKTNLNDRLAYRACPLSKRIELYKALAKERTELNSGTGTDQPDQNRRKRYETKVDILNAADSIFQFFLPSDLQSMTAQKYWGALYRLWETAVSQSDFVGNVSGPPLPDIYPHRGDRDCQDLVEWLQIINRGITPFRDLMSQIPASDRIDIQIPEELESAWLHLLLSFAFLVWEDMQVFDEQMAVCNNLLELGMKKIIQNMSTVRLSKYAVFPPSEFASLLIFQLLQDVNDSALDLDISEVYLEYLKSLESEIESNPLDRGHQNRIVSLKQEISVITETLFHQQRILRLAQAGFSYSRVVTQADFEPHAHELAAHSRSHPLAYYGSREPQHKSAGYVDNDPLPRPVQTSGAAGPNLDPSGVHGLLLQDGLAVVEKRIREFREMHDRAIDLGDWNIQKIDSNKDRQEAAIYAFTIVTIIFLPLSTVASILGMNTFDVRNMTVNQWVFWATALPLMVLIITLCLIWAGELKNVWEGFTKLWGGNGRKGHVMMDEGFERRGGYFDTPVGAIGQNGGGPRRRHVLHGGVKESFV